MKDEIASTQGESRHNEIVNYFWRTIRGYQEVATLSPIVALNCDPLATPTKLGVEGIHYLADVILATRRALKDNEELLEQWERVIAGENTPNAVSIIRRCGAIYQRKQLAPLTYFKVWKRGRPKRQWPKSGGEN